MLFFTYGFSIVQFPTIVWTRVKTVTGEKPRKTEDSQDQVPAFWAAFLKSIKSADILKERESDSDSFFSVEKNYAVRPTEKVTVVYLTQLIPASGIRDWDQLRAMVKLYRWEYNLKAQEKTPISIAKRNGCPGFRILAFVTLSLFRVWRRSLKGIGEDSIPEIHQHIGWPVYDWLGRNDGGRTSDRVDLYDI